MHNAVFVGWGLLAAGEAMMPVVPELGSLTQLSALGVLSWVAWTQRQEIQQLRAQHQASIKELRESWDAWEKLRHSDSAQLVATLQSITANCAAMQATHIEAHGNGK